MTNNSKKIAKAQFQQPCICSDIGELLYYYVFELLSDDASREVEEHLLLCAECENDLSRILTIERVARQRKLRADSARKTDTRAEVLRLADFKK